MKKLIDIEKIVMKNKQVRQMMTEMAMPLKVYIKKIEFYMHDLVENWCLCKWCQMFDPENNNFNHWKKELRAFINQLKDPVIKNSIGKKKHLQRWLKEYYELDTKSMVRRIIQDKFTEEHIIDASQVDEVAQAFAVNVDSLIDIINDDSLSTMNYITSEFTA